MAQEPSKKQQVLVCGGGNGAHVFVGLAASNSDNTVHWLSLYADEAEKINKSLESQPLKVSFQQEKDRILEVKPALVAKDPSKVVPNSDHIIICVPAFAHGQYFEAIAPHMKKGAVISVYPGYGGLTLQYYSIFKKHGLSVRDYTLISCVTLPWACRIEEYGKHVCVLGSKNSVGMIQSGHENANAMKELQGVIGEKPRLDFDDSQHMLSFTLANANAIIHPSIMFAQWKDWTSEDSHPPLDHKPLFYQGITQEGADLMAKLSDETIAIAKAINEALPKDSKKTLQVDHIGKWYKDTYGSQCSDASSMFSIITTNPGYDGLTHPMKKVDEEKELYVPNFRYRYTTEDLPYGLVPIKGLALLVKVETPIIDEIMRWAQKLINVEYITESGDLSGKDIQKGRAPQSFDIKSIKEVFEAY